MKKYMGNKSKIAPIIFNETQKYIQNGGTFFDAFAGTTNVGQYFKAKGYTVFSNDINSTSRILGKVYIETNELPSFNKLINNNCVSAQKILKLASSNEFQKRKDEFKQLNQNTCSNEYMVSIEQSNAFNILVYLSYYVSKEDYTNTNYPFQILNEDFIWRNYCLKGTRSEYFNLVSQKSICSQIELLKKYHEKHSNVKELLEVVTLLEAVYIKPYQLQNISIALQVLNDIINKNANLDTSVLSRIAVKLDKLNKKKNHTGNRMFFSELHGHKIDTILNSILFWFRNELISEIEYNYLLCALIESVAIFSNTSATYQAFYKTYRENTKQTFRLIVPEIIPSSLENKVFCEDSFSLVEKLAIPYDILYLDPPYNWRIYDSNYHLLNLIADYNSIVDNLPEYEEGISGAAGENRNTVRNYTNYNKRETFEDLLFKLILKSSCKLVVISYSDSQSNHNKNSLLSIEKMEHFLTDDSYFIPNSYKKVEIKSKNFESRKSHKKDSIHELLLLAKRKE